MSPASAKRDMLITVLRSLRNGNTASQNKCPGGNPTTIFLIQEYACCHAVFAEGERANAQRGNGSEKEILKRFLTIPDKKSSSEKLPENSESAGNLPRGSAEGGFPDLF